MSKLKTAIEQKDFLKAKRIILDNPELLEENVDLVLGMVEQLDKIKTEYQIMGRSVRYIPPGVCSSTTEDEAEMKSLEKNLEDQHAAIYGPLDGFKSYQEKRSTFYNKELAHEEALKINNLQNKMKKSCYANLKIDNSIPKDEMYLIGEKNTVKVKNIAPPLSEDALIVAESENGPQFESKTYNSFEELHKAIMGDDHPNSDDIEELKKSIVGKPEDLDEGWIGQNIGEVLKPHKAPPKQSWDTFKGNDLVDENLNQRLTPKFKITNPWEDSEKTIVSFDPDHKIVLRKEHEKSFMKLYGNLSAKNIFIKSCEECKDEITPHYSCIYKMQINSVTPSNVKAVNGLFEDTFIDFDYFNVDFPDIREPGAFMSLVTLKLKHKQ
jgi:hypothetical protein